VVRYYVLGFAALLLCAGAAFLGWHLRPACPTVAPVVSTTSAVAKTKSAARKSRVIREIRPDGTQTVTETVIESPTESTTRNQETTSVAVVQPTWSLGIALDPTASYTGGSALLTKPWQVPARIELGYRLLGDFWLTGQAGLDGSVYLGVRYEW